MRPHIRVVVPIELVVGSEVNGTITARLNALLVGV